MCKQEVTLHGFTKHLTMCEKWAAKTSTAKGKTETLLRLRVQPEGRSPFWLDLETRGSATLKDLDHYLRAIWLECCGHMSRFAYGGWKTDEIPKSRRIGDVLEPGITLTHIYDFGTSSITQISAISSRAGRPLTARPITLLARNVMPETTCAECKQSAAWLCMECMIEHDTWGVFCEKHMESHSRTHKDYDPVPLVNSPRVGMCGYEGPAEPPY